MDIKVIFNEQTEKIDIKNGENLLFSIDETNFDTFDQQLHAAKMMYQIRRDIASNDYAQLIVEDFEYYDKGDFNDDEVWEPLLDIQGVNLEVRWMTRLNTKEASVYVIDREGNEQDLSFPDDIRRNFTNQQIKFEKASSRQIRHCFDEEMLQYISNHPSFIVKFCGVKVPREYLLSDDKEMLFDFTTSMNT